METQLATRLQHGASALARQFPSRPSVLGAPPAGSGLRPIAGRHGAPLVGRSLDIMTDLIALAREQHERFGTVSWMGAFGTKAAFVLGPEAVGQVLANKERAFSSERGWNYFIGPFFERGVMLMDGDEHRHHRRIMQEAFKRERLVGYLAGMNPEISRGLDGWQAGPAFGLHDAVKQLTLDIATRIFVGDELGPRADAVNTAFVDCVVGGQTFIRASMPGGRWRRGLEGRRLLIAYFRELLPAKRADVDGADLFSVLCRAQDEHGRRFDDRDVINHMIFLLMAAHDTSTLTVTMAAYLLGRHPAWQDRLRAESLALGRDHLTHEDLEQLTALDLVFKETLRMYAPVGVVMREAACDTTLDGFHVPAGTRLVVGIYPTQRMEPWWSAPDVFDPERFAEDRREDRAHQYAWAPFGGTAHKCIGMHFGAMEVKTILHQMLRRFEWRVPDGYHPPMAYATGPVPADGLPIALQRRRPS
jgi:cytochrome P450